MPLTDVKVYATKVFTIRTEFDDDEGEAHNLAAGIVEMDGWTVADITVQDIEPSDPAEADAMIAMARRAA